jgi:MoaA/NifB/PqqE/SkfB family radical SAM enzyme
VSSDELLWRIDKLADLGTTMIHLSGGEPMLHPELPRIVRRVRSRGILVGLLTNGYLLGPKPICELNEAGLDYLQISIDNLKPDSVSMKSLKVLDRKLRWLAQYAKFDVNVNTVVGTSLKPAEDAVAVARRVVELGFSVTIGIIHGQRGQLRPLGPEQRQVFKEVEKLRKKLFSFTSHSAFQENMLRGLPTEWHCRAGSRYLYVCEDGLVHYCSQRRGTPAIPLSEYACVNLQKEYDSEKPCTAFCTVSCVHRIAWLDELRSNPRQALCQFFPPQTGTQLRPSDLPVSVRLLAKFFLPEEGSQRPRRATRLVLRLLGVGPHAEESQPVPVDLGVLESGRVPKRKIPK